MAREIAYLQPTTTDNRLPAAYQSPQKVGRGEIVGHQLCSPSPSMFSKVLYTRAFKIWNCDKELRMHVERIRKFRLLAFSPFSTIFTTISTLYQIMKF